jgi:hypothetical protein
MPREAESAKGETISDARPIPTIAIRRLPIV